LPLARLVPPCQDVNDTSFPSKLPGFRFFDESRTGRARVGQLGIWRGNRMRRHVKLSSGVPVNRQDVAVVRPERPNAKVVIDLEPRPTLRPSAWKAGGHQ